MNSPPDSAQNPGNQFRKNAENELKESRQLLKKIEEIGGIGHWEVDLLTGENNWSEQFFHILGLDPDITPTTDLGFPLFIRRTGKGLPMPIRSHVRKVLHIELKKGSYGLRAKFDL